MSDHAPAEAALAELDRLVRHLGEELTFFRRRALEAERRWRESTEHAGSPADESAAREALVNRVEVLERENADLRSRLDDAAQRTRQMAERLRFLRQQEGGRSER